MVQGHKHEHPGLHPCESVHKEHPCQASLKIDLFEVEPQYAEGAGKSGGAHEHICEGKTGLKDVHRSV